MERDLVRRQEPLRVVVVDDEELARVRMKRLLAREADVEVVAEAADGATAIDVVRRDPPDVLLLDVQMPGVDGFGVLSALGDAFGGQVVFVTAHDEHAVRAFEVSAIDYLLKPVAADRLHAALGRVRERRMQRDVVRRHTEVLSLLDRTLGVASGRVAATDAAPDDPDAGGNASVVMTGRGGDRFVVRRGDRTILVKAADVDWIEAEANYVRLHVGAASHLVRATMASLELSLDAAQFARIHRTTIVNLDRIREIQPWFSGDQVVVLADGTKLRMSRSYGSRLLQRLHSG